MAKSPGRGLGALIGGGGDQGGPRPDASAPVAPSASPVAAPPTASPAGPLAMLAVEKIRPNPFQPRLSLPPESLAELAESIRRAGVVQPILVRPKGPRDAAGRPESYELVAGERRWRASGLAGLKEIPALVRETSDRQMIEHALIENLQREDLSPIEIGEALAALSNRFALTHEEVGQRVAMNRTTVTNFIRLLDLEDEIRELLASKQLQAAHGHALLMVEVETERLELARRTAREGWSVKRLKVEAGIERAETGARGERKRGWPFYEPKELRGLREQLEEHLGTRVRLKVGTKRRYILIEYHDDKELDLLAGLLLAEPPGGAGDGAEGGPLLARRRGRGRKVRRRLGRGVREAAGAGQDAGRETETAAEREAQEAEAEAAAEAEPSAARAAPGSRWEAERAEREAREAREEEAEHAAWEAEQRAARAGGAGQPSARPAPASRGKDRGAGGAGGAGEPLDTDDDDDLLL